MTNPTIASVEDVKNLPVGTELTTVEGWTATKEETTLNQCWRVKSPWREGYYPPSRLFEEHGPLRVVSLPKAPKALTPPASETSTEPDLVKDMAREIYRLEWKADLYATPFGPVVAKYERRARTMLASPVVERIKMESAREALLNAAAAATTDLGETTHPDRPAWDEEAAARAADALAYSKNVRVYGDYGAGWRDGVRAGAALAVAREHLPTKPDREGALKRAYRDRQTPIQEEDAWAFGEGVRAGIDAVLDLWPGRSDAEVKAEALQAVRAAVGNLNRLDEYGDVALRHWIKKIDAAARAEGGAS